MCVSLLNKPIAQAIALSQRGRETNQVRRNAQLCLFQHRILHGQLAYSPNDSDGIWNTIYSEGSRAVLTLVSTPVNNKPFSSQRCDSSSVPLWLPSSMECLRWPIVSKQFGPSLATIRMWLGLRRFLRRKRRSWASRWTITSTRALVGRNLNLLAKTTPLLIFNRS